MLALLQAAVDRRAGAEEAGERVVPALPPRQGRLAIYDERTPVCHDFACEWLINPKVGDEWQPLRSKIVIYITEEGGDFFLVFVVDPGIPKRLREASYYQSIKAAALSGLRSETGTYLQTLVVIGERRWLILPHRDVEITSRWYKVVPNGDDQWEVLIFNDEEHGRRVLAAVDQYVEILTPELIAEAELIAAEAEAERDEQLIREADEAMEQQLIRKQMKQRPSTPPRTATASENGVREPGEMDGLPAYATPLARRRSRVVSGPRPTTGARSRRAPPCSMSGKD